MIESAGVLVAADRYPEAADQLKAAADRCDGDEKPPDFVSETASAELNSRVNEIISLLESMEQD